MDFIDEPQFGHKHSKLPVVLVPLIMFLVLLLCIYASDVYVDNVLGDSHDETGTPWLLVS